MARFNILALLTVVLASGFTTAVPVAAETEDIMMSPNVDARAGFKYRFYTLGNCDHNAPAASTFPRNNLSPLLGNTGGTCYSAPTNALHNRLEISTSPPNVITFCNINCQGSGSVPQASSPCYSPFPGCAIGSFKVL